MTGHPADRWRIGIVVAILAAYAVVLPLLVVTYRTEQSLKRQVAAAESAAPALQAASPAAVRQLRADLAAARERLSALEGRVQGAPTADDVLARVNQAAQASGLAGLQCERKSETVVALKTGEYKVHRHVVRARGTPEAVAGFLSLLQRDAGETMIVENISLSDSGSLWQMSGDILYYMLGD